jgi:dTDP-4-amino-4,6-dideoxygalactose transaminase
MSDAPIPLVDLKAQFAAIEDEVRTGIDRVLTSQLFISGPETSAFEQEFAAFAGVEHAVALANGTVAIEMALEASDVGPGDEVVTVSHTFFATTEAVVRRGAVPVYVDVTEDTWTMDPDQVASAVTERTKAILPVHIYGHPADVPALQAAAPGVPVLEDAAQAHGATCHGLPVGATTRGATFSFFPGKNLGAYGDGGAFVTNDAELAGRVRQLRDHGRVDKYEHSTVGTNARLAEIQAAVLRAKLPHLRAWTEARHELALRYETLLASSGLRWQATAAWATNARHLFVVLHPLRDEIASRLRDQGVATGIHYPIPCHLQPAMGATPWRSAGELTVTEMLALNVLSLPLYPELTDGQVDRVASALEESAERITALR